VKIKRHVYSLLIFVLLAACAFLRTHLVHAALGEDAASIELDRAAFAAKRNASRSTAIYSVEEMVAGLTTIREYVSSSGTVFGVAWMGTRPPDLNVLLGSYADDYQTTQAQATQTTRVRGRQPISVKGDHVVVETWGHMRKLQGHAYDPSLIPEGVTAHDIQ
jgi:hypothetical protein